MGGMTAAPSFTAALSPGMYVYVGVCLVFDSLVLFHHLSYLQSCSKVDLKHCHQCPWPTTPHVSACVSFCILTHSLSLRWPVPRCWSRLSFSCLKCCRNVANGECVGRWGNDDWERRRRRGDGQTDRCILVNVLWEWMNVWKIVNWMATEDWMAPCAMSLCAYVSVRVCTCKISLDAERKSGLRWGGGVPVNGFKHL